MKDRKSENSQAKRRIHAGRKLRDDLRGDGMHAMANVINELCQSLSASTGTNKKLWRDNMALRKELEALKNLSDFSGSI